MKTDINNGLFHCRLFNAIRQQRGGALTNGAAVDAVGGDRRAIAGGKIEVAKTDDGQILRNTSSTAFRFHHCPLRQGIGTAGNHVKFPFDSPSLKSLVCVYPPLPLLSEDPIVFQHLT